MSELPLTPPHEITTERLVLRSARAGDGPALHEAIRVSLNEMSPWLPFAAKLSDVATMEEVSKTGAQMFLNKECYVWRAWDQSKGIMAGTVDLRPRNLEVPSYEIGYWIRSDYAGKGYAKEIVGRIVEMARDQLQALRVEARCDSSNERSWRLVERLGFSHEGTAQHDGRNAAGALTSTKIYALLLE